MKTHFSIAMSVLVALATLLTLVAAPGQTQAQDLEPQSPDTVVPGAVPVQGKLTNASGIPLNGTYTVAFKLYETDTGGVPLCQDTVSVTVTNGLFSSYMDHCYNGKLTGQKVWLAIQVGGDPEMTPRQVIYPVLYSLGLVPGVVVNATTPDIMTLSTSSTSGAALNVAMTAASGENYGVYSTSASSSGYAGYFTNSSSGMGLFATSTSGIGVRAGSLGTALVASGGLVSISAEGSGKIKSTAKSYVWISGNGVRPFYHNDPTYIDMDNVGGAKIFSGINTAATRNVILPITITSPLYGQEVTISAIDIYWRGADEFEVISAVYVRRQTGVCETDSPSCFMPIVSDQPLTHYNCPISGNTTGCVIHYAPSANNVLTSSSGILYMTLELSFTQNTSIEIGGVRLTLEHD